MKKIIGIGNCLVDVLTPVGGDEALLQWHLPKGSMQLVDAARAADLQRQIAPLPHERRAGGSAANTLKALALVGAPAAFIGKVAPDANGHFYEQELREAQVDTLFIKEPAGATGVALTFITPDGQRTFATHLGVAAGLQPADIPPSLLAGSHLLYVEGYLVQNHALMEHVLEAAQAQKLTVSLDMASYNIVEQDRDFFHTLLERYVDVVFANEEEARAFTGKEGHDAARALGQLCQTAVVKLGARGACVFTEGECVEAPAETVSRVVDTTGAGDYFAAGYLYAYTQQASPYDCLRTGSKLAGQVIQVTGTALEPSQKEEVRQFFATFP